MISFIIPAYDEERLLPRTLISIHEAAKGIGEPYEVIVSDDNSSDRTADVAEAHGARVVRVAHRHIAATRNSGAREAAGDRFIFVDADTVVDEALIRAAIAAWQDGAIGGGAGVEFDGRVPYYAKVILPVMVRTFRMAGMACGCFIFCTREAFEAVGGFNEAYYGAEELAISRALKRQGRFVILRERVITSGRKLRTYSGWEILHILGGMMMRGSKAVSDRRGMGLWYEKRREDTEAPA